MRLVFVEGVSGVISQEDRDAQLDDMVSCVTETDEERRARIYPIVLQPHNPAWADWYTEEKANLIRHVGADNIARINHYGSTAVPGLDAKPTVDILLEMKEGFNLRELAGLLPQGEYFFQWRDMADDPLILYKGYTPTGFGERVFHVHVRHEGDWDELYFRDELLANPDTAVKYAALKQRLMREFTHDRDGYTDAKGAFIREITAKARERNVI
ncbi:MAG: GrpB family protein [Defluviitaleaceae bacterium]|nr:GrpB family protein [Defluviitaleaceae bacterium]